MASSYKPVGGVKRALLYPADAVKTALFSSEGCQVQFLGIPIEVELREDKSSYEECAESSKGQVKITHTLHIVSDRDKAKRWLETDFLERASADGVVAQVVLADDRRLLLGYSSVFGNEQPLRLESLKSTSGTTLHDRPYVALRFVAHDTEFSCEVI